MYIHRLQIENLRCFREAWLDFTCPPILDTIEAFGDFAVRFALSDQPNNLRVPNVNLLLGDNGAGKTTILRAIALGLLGPILEGNSGWVPYRMIRRTGEQIAATAGIIASSQLHEQDEPQEQNFPAWDKLDKLMRGVSQPNFGTLDTGLQVNITRRGDLEILGVRPMPNQGMEQLYNDRSPAFFVLGYGATRRTESSEEFDSSARSKNRILRYQRVAGLFEDHITLVPLSAWLPQVENSQLDRFEEVRSLLNTLLPDQTELVSIPRDSDDYLLSRKPANDYQFRLRDGNVPFQALSDGYRAYISWVSDMLYHLTLACPRSMKLTECRGVVMIDEVDLHLHPSWQRIVVDTLSKTFPRLQFILTTHSPMIAGNLEPSNIWVLENNEDGSVSPKQYRERIFGLSADQILTSSYFNLLTTRAPEAEKEIRDLASRAADGDGDASLEALRRLTGNIDNEDLSDTEIVVP